MARGRRGIKEIRKLQVDFLLQYEQTVMVSSACKKAKIPLRTLYNWMETDEFFKTQFEVSKKRTIDRLEEEAQRRAFQGVKEPVYQGGKKVGYIQKYSDTLLQFLIKHNKKEVYTETVRQEHTGQNGEPIKTEATVISNVDYTKLSTKALEEILKSRIEVKDTE